MTREELLRRSLLIPCADRAHMWRWIAVYLDIRLPDVVVDRDSNCTPLDLIWEAYSTLRHGGELDPRSFLFWASRDSYKTLSFAIFQLMALLHCDTDVVHMAAIELQARKAADYVRGFLARPYLKDLKIGDNLRELKVVQYNAPGREPLSEDQYLALSPLDRHPYMPQEHKTIIIPATVRAANGQHALTLCIDEAEIIQDRRALKEARLIPTQYKGRLPVTLITSSRKYSGGIVQEMIDDAPKTKMQLKHWNIIDITERCPPERHRPDLPRERLFRSDELLRVVKPDQFLRLDPNTQKKYVEAEVDAGCASCELYAPCRGDLRNQTSRSNLLRSIPYTIQLFRDTDTDTALSQLLSRRPSRVGMIYSQLDPQRHKVTASRIIEMVTGEEPVGTDGLPRDDITFDELVDVLRKHDVQFYAGMDFGYTDPWAVVLGARIGHRMFILTAIEVPGLDAGQQVAMAEKYIKPFGPMIYADPEDKQMVLAFRKAGFRMVEWKKGPGSVLGGISIVRLKMAPYGADPQIFFLAGEPGVEALFDQLSAYRWKQDAKGETVEVPDEGDDHGPDAFRYLIMNVYAKGGNGIVTGDNAAQQNGLGMLPVLPPVQGDPTQPQPVHGSYLKHLVDKAIAEKNEGDSGRIHSKGRMKWIIT